MLRPYLDACSLVVEVLVRMNAIVKRADGTLEAQRDCSFGIGVALDDLITRYELLSARLNQDVHIRDRHVHRLLTEAEKTWKELLVFALQFGSFGRLEEAMFSCPDMVTRIALNHLFDEELRLLTLDVAAGNVVPSELDTTLGSASARRECAVDDRMTMKRSSPGPAQGRPDAVLSAAHSHSDELLKTPASMTDMSEEPHEETIPKAPFDDLDLSDPAQFKVWEARAMKMGRYRSRIQRQRLIDMGIIREDGSLVSDELPPDMRPESKTSVETG